MTTPSSRFAIERLRPLFPGSVSLEAVIVTDHDVDTLEPLTEEERGPRTMAAKRLREYRAGRHCAKRALLALGAPTASLPRDEDGVPCFPQGIVASITHTGRDQTLAIAGASRAFRGLGIDAEAVRSLEPEVVAQIASAEEMSLVSKVAAPERAALAIFSAKESFYKCAYPEMRLFLGFHEVTVRQAHSRDGMLFLELVSEKAARAGGPSELTVPALLLDHYVISRALWENS